MDMAQEMVNVQIGEEIYQYEKGTTYREIALAHQKDYDNDIVLVFGSFHTVGEFLEYLA